MANKRFYWLKLKEDFFQDRKMKALRKKENGGTLILIYLKLLLSCLKNDGFFYYENLTDNYIEEIALEIDENYKDVELAIDFLVKNNLIEVGKNENRLLLTELPNMTGSETDSARRMRNLRERNDAFEELKVSQSDVLPSQSDDNKQAETSENTEMTAFDGFLKSI
ncbi:MAG: hypothetical protein GX328_04445 [Clostridiaceae bacterium]|nr:hypothetical protein [Clostridiaceae bacterium]